jgi:hypothetical protein
MPADLLSAKVRASVKAFVCFQCNVSAETSLLWFFKVGSLPSMCNGSITWDIRDIHGTCNSVIGARLEAEQ